MSTCNQSDIKYPYYVNVPMSSSVSGINGSCWMTCYPSFSPLYSPNGTDLEIRISEEEATLNGIAATIIRIPGSILNFLVILAVMRSPDLQTEYLAPSVASITITDLLYSLYVLPSTALHQFKRQMIWPEGCNSFGLFRWGLWMVSVFNLIGIAGLRCFAINFPRKTKNKSFQYCCRIVPIIGWVLTLILHLPTLTHQYGRLGLVCKEYSCLMINVDTEQNPFTPGPMIIYVMIILVSGILLLVLNVVTYVQVSKQSKKIFSQIKDTSKDEAMKVLRNEKTVGKMVALITTSFFLVYVPLMILGWVYADTQDIKNPAIGVVCSICSYLLVIFDPVIYIYCSKKYRNGIKVILNPVLSRVIRIN